MSRCFMDNEGDMIPEEGKGERFFVVIMQELTIYGHTVDHWIKKHYAEDWPATEREYRSGRIYGCWHSPACPDGELGSNWESGCVSIPHERFVEARSLGWPDAASAGLPITQPGPVSSVGFVNEKGEVVEAWNSLEGDKR